MTKDETIYYNGKIEYDFFLIIAEEKIKKGNFYFKDVLYVHIT
jgi:hypothetical protein